jgi:NNP family nitrate/nitrite transporter-like MFS transporter
VWALSLIYGACFGIELTIDNIAVLYFLDYFSYFQQLEQDAAMKTAGLIAGMFGSMNLFARAIGGWVADKCGNCWGLDGRVKWLFVALFGEGIGLMLFSQATTLTVAKPLMITFAMFVKMSNGATYAVVPFINRQALGAVSGIVGAGGNVGAVVLGFLFKSEAIDWRTAMLIAGVAVTCISFTAFLITSRAETAEVESIFKKHPGYSPSELAAAV